MGRMCDLLIEIVAPAQEFLGFGVVNLANLLTGLVQINGHMIHFRMVHFLSWAVNAKQPQRFVIFLVLNVRIGQFEIDFRIDQGREKALSLQPGRIQLNEKVANGREKGAKGDIRDGLGEGRVGWANK